MPSSGTTGLSTSDDTGVIAIPASALQSGTWFNVIIVNTGANAGFYSLDGGASLNYLTAQVSSVPGGVFLNNVRMGLGNEVLIYRIPGGSNLSGVFVTVA